MSKTKEEMSVMASKKINSKRIIDRLISEELLKMGFTYSKMGTHFLHDSIVISTSMKLEDYYSVSEFCDKIAAMICKKYGIGKEAYSISITRAIEITFQIGNMDYILETFQNSYDQENMRIPKNSFIMTVRRKILGELEELEEQRKYNATQLRIIIQGELEGISDVLVLEGIRNILFSIKGEGITESQLARA